jgi:hypothetical protein
VLCRTPSLFEERSDGRMVLLWWLVQLAHHPKDTVLHDLLQVGQRSSDGEAMCMVHIVGLGSVCS